MLVGKPRAPTWMSDRFRSKQALQGPSAPTDLHVKQEDLEILQVEHYNYKCIDLATNVVCPFGWVSRDSFGCSHDPINRPCPSMDNATLTCWCDVCVPACPKHAELQRDGICHCVDGTFKFVGKCTPIEILALELVLPIFVILGALGVFCVYRQRQRADLIWRIKSTDLSFDDPPEVRTA